MEVNALKKIDQSIHKLRTRPKSEEKNDSKIQKVDSFRY